MSFIGYGRPIGAGSIIKIAQDVTPSAITTMEDESMTDDPETPTTNVDVNITSGVDQSDTTPPNADAQAADETPVPTDDQGRAHRGSDHPDGETSGI